MKKDLRIFLAAQALITLAAAVVLFVKPELIPNTVNIKIEKHDFLIAYLLGSAELAFGFLSWYTRDLTDTKSIKLILFTFLIFHAATAFGELIVICHTGEPLLWLNFFLRVIICGWIIKFYINVSNESWFIPILK